MASTSARDNEARGRIGDRTPFRLLNGTAEFLAAWWIGSFQPGTPGVPRPLLLACVVVVMAASAALFFARIRGTGARLIFGHPHSYRRLQWWLLFGRPGSQDRSSFAMAAWIWSCAGAVAVVFALVRLLTRLG
jgi:hypothetical protein